MHISRRRFAHLTGTVVLGAGGLPAQRSPLTAQQIIDRIQHELGSAPPGALDGVKAGGPGAVVTGIATTAMATMDVLSRAVKEKTNLVLTLEPVFYGRLDGQSPPAAQAGAARGGAGLSADDPVYAAKKEFIQKNGLVVFRLDRWHTRKPDPFGPGLAEALGWTKHQVKDDPLRYDIPAVTIGALADDLAKRLKARAGIRVVGDAQSRVRRVVLIPGVSAMAAMVKALPDADLVIAGEVREWESVEYAQDTVTAGQKKGLITVGRVLSLDPGMNVCAGWLKKLVPEVPVRWLATGDPYWRPA